VIMRHWFRTDAVGPVRADGMDGIASSVQGVTLVPVRSGAGPRQARGGRKYSREQIPRFSAKSSRRPCGTWASLRATVEDPKHVVLM